MTTSEILIKVPDWFQMASMGLTVVTLVATIAVRLTPSKVDDQFVSAFSKYLLKILKILPTLGVNPQTKKLEEAIFELREKTQV